MDHKRYIAYTAYELNKIMYWINENTGLYVLKSLTWTSGREVRGKNDGGSDGFYLAIMELI